MLNKSSCFGFPMPPVIAVRTNKLHAGYGVRMRFPLILSDHHIPIPYPAVDHGDSQNHGFIDIKNRPELAETIPEAKDCPPLLALLKAISHRDTPFATLGCEKAYSDYSSENHPELKWNLCGYVDLCFARVDENVSREAFEELAFKIATFGQDKPQPRFVKFSMELSPAMYSPLQSAGITDPAYCMSIWVAGFGATEVEAFERYSAIMAILTEFFEKQAWL